MSPLLIPWRLKTITSSSGAISIGVRGTKGLMPRVDAKTFICAWRKKSTNSPSTNKHHRERRIHFVRLYNLHPWES